MNDVTQTTQTTQTTVKRGRGRPRIHAVNNMKFVRTAEFHAGASSAIPTLDETVLTMVGRRFRNWFDQSFAPAEMPAIPNKGNWLRNFGSFMDLMPQAESAGVFNLTEAQIQVAEAAADADQTDTPDEEANVDLTTLEPVSDSADLVMDNNGIPVVIHAVPLRGPGGKFLSRAEREELTLQVA